MAAFLKIKKNTVSQKLLDLMDCHYFDDGESLFTLPNILNENVL